MKIAIDGPSGAGKSTVAKQLAKKLTMTYIDTGAMYRAVAVAVIALGIPTDDAEAVKAELNNIEVSIGHDGVTGEQIVYLNGADVTPLIRTPQVSSGASDVSRIPDVKLKMVEQQRLIAKDCDVIMDGRDIGTFVFPDAEKKYYLTASAGERARRRYLELRAKGARASYDECLSELLRRDENDSSRSLAPLAVADDAIILETDNMTAPEVTRFLLHDIRRHSSAANQDACSISSFI